MKRRLSLTLSVCATILALTFVLGWIPYGGLFLLPLLFTACNFDFFMSAFAGLAFGLFSLAYSYLIGGAALISLYFMAYPLLPIIPRILVGMIAYGVFKLSTKLIKKVNLGSKIFSISITAAIGTFSNTFLVGLFVIIINRVAPISGEEIFTLGQLLLAGIIEIVVNTIILPPIVLAVRKAAPKLFNEMMPNHPFNTLAPINK